MPAEGRNDMDNALFIAKLLGPIYLILGFGMLLNRQHMAGLYSEIAESPALMYLGAVLALVVGSLIVRFHNDWTLRWTLLITLLGWLAVLKGVLRVLAPEWSQAKLKSYATSGAGVAVAAPAAFILGAILTAGGYGWL